MKISFSLDEYTPSRQGCVMSIGNFDGVHLGHQYVLSYAHDLAVKEQLPLVVMTFAPAPLKILKPEMAPRVLTPLTLKKELFKRYHVDNLIVIPTTKEFLSLKPEAFIEQILLSHFSIRYLVEGVDFHFGRRASGEKANVPELAGHFGFKAHLLDDYVVSLATGESIDLSSTLVRQLISASRFDDVRTCLGRDYMLLGEVISGRGKGRELGFPTANLKLLEPEQLLLEDGVFSGYVHWDRDLNGLCSRRSDVPAAISIGTGQTFGLNQKLIEAHVLNPREDLANLTGQYMAISPVRKIRAQRKFASTEELSSQIEKDCREIRDVLTDYEAQAQAQARLSGRDRE